MSADLEALHRRYLQQAGWTRQVREYLFDLLGITSANRVLEAGCGTGAVLTSLLHEQGLDAWGLDIDYAALRYAAGLFHQPNLTAADILHPPFKPGSFDALICHFLLVWIRDVPEALHNMVALTRPGGWVIALAEPDYSARIDHPAELAALGSLQTQALARRGAGSETGRQLRGWFASAGLVEVRSGLLGGEWCGHTPDEGEKVTLLHDLEGQVDYGYLQSLLKADRTAELSGTRIRFIPTFYAIGKVPPEKR